MPDPPPNPFRVTREFSGVPLTQSQQRVLAALVSVCPESGCDVSARVVADAAGLRLGSVVVVLRSLVKKHLAIVHEADERGEDGWAPTLTGRSRVRHFPAQAAPAEQRAQGEPPG